MVKSQSRINNLSYRVYLDWSYLETDMENFGSHLCGRLFVYIIKLYFKKYEKNCGFKCFKIP